MGNRKSKKENHIKRKNENNSTKLITTWNELKECEGDSETHILKVRDCCASIYSKVDDKFYEYLSTHTFYGMWHKSSTKLLQKYGFNVVIDNWDKERTIC